MLASKLYAPTLREIPADADVVSQKYMLKAGLIRKMAGGIYTYLPLAWRSIRKIEAIIHEEMEKSGAQEIMMPIIQPSELWLESGRWNVYGAEMIRLKDRHNREYCLGPTHEEMVTSIVRNEVKSYKQLPLCLYQIQNKYRDERRPRFGLMRSREFIMKDGYSFDQDEAGLDASYHTMYDAYSRIFDRCGLKVRPVEADSGAIGGSNSHEFMALAESGEADVIHCTKCDYAANIEIGRPAALTEADEEALPLEEVVTPNCKTIEAVAEYLHLPIEKTIKAVVYNVDGLVVLAMVRGDHDVNEIALQHAVNGAIEPEMASEEDLKKVGLTAGFISPVGLHKSDDFAMVVDETIMNMHNVCGGANKVDAHYIHINPTRDFSADDIIVAPIRLITDTDVCPHCGSPLAIAKGIEVGQVFKLGTKYSQSMGAMFLDQNGKSKPLIMGCYGIGVSRTLAAAIEQFHDEDGIIWPRAIAPYEVAIVPVNAKDEALMNMSQSLYDELQKEGVEVLLDDRKERAGVKFKDADLIGYPLRITISKKSIETSEIEIKVRKDGQIVMTPIDEAVAVIRNLLKTL